jgi:hypothetical protein
MPDAEKLLRVQAMMRLSGAKAPDKKKSGSDTSFFDVLKGRGDAEWDAYWAWFAGLTDDEQDLLEDYTGSLKGPKAEVFLRMPEARRLAGAQKYRDEDPIEVANVAVTRLRDGLKGLANAARADTAQYRGDRDGDYARFLAEKRRGRLGRFLLGR